MLKDTIRNIVRSLGFDIYRLPSDATLYQPYYCPWNSPEFAKYYAVAKPASLVSSDRCYVLERLLRQTLSIRGDVFECGVYRGGTAALLSMLLEEVKSPKKLYLFDTFEGMPATDSARDFHAKG